jgi:hypothetical protein
MSEHTDKYDSVIAQTGGLDKFRLKLGPTPTLPEPIIELCKTALAAGDEHLNTIPLFRWDRMAECYDSQSCKMTNYFGWPKVCSLADRVCTLKRAAVRIANGE